MFNTLFSMDNEFCIIKGGSRGLGLHMARGFLKAGAARVYINARKREKSIDVLVNNAGVGWGAPLEEFPEKGWDKFMNLNVKTPFFLTQALLLLKHR